MLACSHIQEDILHWALDIPCTVLVMAPCTARSLSVVPLVRVVPFHVPVSPLSIHPAVF